MTLKENNFIGVIIKPDAFCDSIQGQITTDILKNNFKIRFAKTMQIDSRQVMYVYPDKIHTDRFPYSHYSITHGISRLLLLEKENAYEDFMRIKSNCIGELGIREKYRKKTKEDLEKEGIHGPALEYRLCQNRIHSCDCPNGTALILRGLLNKKEILIIKCICEGIFKRINDIFLDS